MCITQVKTKWVQKTSQVLTYLPYFISTVVVAGMINNFLSPSGGIINMVLVPLGAEPENYLGLPQYFRMIYVLSGIWQSFGFNSIIFVAAIMAIPLELYEAMDVDGAGKWRKTWNLILPSIKPTIILMPNLDENQSCITSGMVEPLDEHFDVMPNFSRWLEENPTIKASLTASDGHIYYVPTTNVTNNYQPVIMYNMKWLADAGLEVPTTLDEFVEMLRYYKSHDMNGNGELDEVPLSVQDEFLMYMFAPAFGLTFTSDEGSGFFVNDEGVVQYAQATPEYKEYLGFLHDLYEEGLLEIEYTTLTRDQIIERFAQDRAGVTFDFSWQMSMTYSPQLPYYDGTPETGVVGQVPLSGPHEGYFIGRNPIGLIYGVNADSDKIELACKFLDYAMSEPNQVMYCWGIEGLSYVTNEDGSRTMTEQAADNNWLQSLGINPAQVLPAQQSVESTDALVPQWHADVDKMEAQYIKAPWPFIYATEEESMTASMYMVDIQTYVNEMAVSFVTGTTSLDDYDSYLEALDRMNLPEMLEIRTAQYERYKAAL